jgi:PAS domain S-box-containing protein
MKKTPSRPKRIISLRFIYILIPAFFILGVLLPAGYYLFRNQERRTEQDIQEQLALEATRIDSHIHQILSVTQHLNALTGRAIEDGNLDHQSVSALQDFFLASVEEFDFISSMYFGNPEGGLADAGREADPERFFVIYTDGFKAGEFFKYALDDNREPAELLSSIPDFDARQRAWYKNAVSAQGPVWSEVYVLFTGDDLALSASQPVYAEDGALLGVVATDLFLGKFSRFLADQPVFQTGQSLLLERDGMLIASSAHPIIYSDGETGLYERFSLGTIPEPILNALEEKITADPALDLAILEETTRLVFEQDQKKYYASLSPLSDIDGLDWVSIVIVPEADFWVEIRKSRQVLMLIFAHLAILLVVFSWFGTRAAMRSFIDFQKRIEDFDIETDWELFEDTHFKEINVIGHAFNRVIFRLQSTLTDLKQEVLEHEESRQQLQLSENLYRSVVEDLPGLLCNFKPDGEIAFANENYAAYYDLSPQEMIGTSFLNFLHSDDRLRVMEEIHALTPQNPSNSLIQRVILPSGEIRHQRWMNRAIFSDEGEMVTCQAFGEDIQEEYQSQQMQNALYRIWQAANSVPSTEELFPILHEIIQEIVPPRIL